MIGRLFTMAMVEEISPTNPCGWIPAVRAALDGTGPSLLQLEPAPGVPSVQSTAANQSMAVYVDRMLGAVFPELRVGTAVDGSPATVALRSTAEFDNIIATYPRLLPQLTQLFQFVRTAVPGAESIGYVGLPPLAGYIGNAFEHLRVLRQAGCLNLGLDVGFYVDPTQPSGWDVYDRLYQGSLTSTLPRLCGENVEPVNGKLLSRIGTGYLRGGTGLGLVMDWNRYLAMGSAPPGTYLYAQGALMYARKFVVVPASVDVAERQDIWDGGFQPYDAADNLMIDVDGVVL